MNIDKKKPLWRRLQILYKYRWMDAKHPFMPDTADVTWCLLHNSKQFERRMAEYEAEQERIRQERHQIILAYKEMERRMRNEAVDRRNSEGF